MNISTFRFSQSKKKKTSKETMKKLQELFINVVNGKQAAVGKRADMLSKLSLRNGK